MAKPIIKPRLAVVLSGGGARGAYEAGIIHYIRTKLPKEIALKRAFGLYCGSSVGAITSCFLASTAHDLKLQGNLIKQLWLDLKQENIYKRNLGALSSLARKSMFGIGRNLMGLTTAGTASGHFSGLLDTSPLSPFLKKAINWDQLHKNISSRTIDAVSLTGTNMRSGKMELFIDKHDDVTYTGEYIARYGALTDAHARASAAIPIVFPNINVNGTYYADGGLRLNTPLSPAIQLGADRILVIGLHPVKMRSLSEIHPLSDFIDPEPTNTPPSLGQVIGVVLNSLFLDRIDYDLEQLARINRIIHWGELTYGKDFLDQINGALLKNNIRGDIANRGLKKLNILSIFPSESISKVFVECCQDPKILKKYLGSFEKFILRILDVDLENGQNFLSYLMFIPEYIEAIFQMGCDDASKHHDELIGFFS